MPIIEELGLPAFYIYKCCMASIPITGRCKKFHLCVTCLGFGLPFTVPWVNWVLVGPGNSPMAVLLGYKRGGGVPMTLGWFSCLGNSFCCNIKNFCCETEIWNKNSRKLFDFGISSASFQTLHYLLHPGCFLVLTFSSRCTICYQKELVLYYLLETQGDLFQ